MKIEIDGETETLTFNGIMISFHYLLAITNPDPNMVHRFVRMGNSVHVKSHLRLTEFIPGGAIN